MRYSALAPINKMPNEAPLSKKAVGKRAYRGKPTNGYCASPEAAWASFTWENIAPLEEMLRFFHVTCSDLVKSLAVADRIKFLGQVDIHNAQAFLLFMNSKSAKKDAKVR